MSVPFPTADDSAEDPAQLQNDQPRPTRRFYHSHSNKEFSRSAAKRQSVMQLPSIKHLQHQYVKMGLSSTPSTALRPGSTIAAMVSPDSDSPNSNSAPKGKSNLKLGLGARLTELRDEDLPPSPARPEVDRRMPWELRGEADQGLRSVRDVKELRREVMSGLEGVCERWGLVSSRPQRRASHSRSSYSSYSESGFPPPDNLRFSTSSPVSDRPFSPFSTAESDPTSPTSSTTSPLVLELLETTTAAIRSVQSYVVALPSDAFTSTSTSTLPSSARPRSSIATSTLSPPPSTEPTPRRVSTSTLPPSSLPSSPAPLDPLLQLRKTSLDLLGALKEMEGRYRLTPLGESAAPGPSGAAPDLEEPEEEAPSLSPSLSRSDSEWDSSATTSEAAGAQSTSYRTDVALEDLSKEVEVVRRFVEVVNDLLRASAKSGAGSAVRGRKGVRRSEMVEIERKELVQSGSVGQGLAGLGESKVPMVVEPELARGGDQVEEVGAGREEASSDEESEEEEDALPPWAQENGFDDPLERAHALLHSHLSPSLLPRLLPPTSPSFRSAFLLSLSDGLLLCDAYNSIVRSSERPFGFISEKDVHRTLPAEGGGATEMARSKSEGERRVGDTFRRAENLRVWAAALKFRYLISFDPPKPSPISSTTAPPSPNPSSSDPTPFSTNPNSTSAPKPFDALLIARREEGWMEMLEDALGRWVEKVVLERREEAGGGI